MLILAGVSISAIVGEDGVITKAQDATILQSCVELERFLQERYTIDEMDEVVEFRDDGTEMTPLEKMVRKYPTWFYSHGTENYVLSEYTYSLPDGTSKTDYLTLRLINKSGLIEEDTELGKIIKGGEANGSEETAYLNLIDVYGVTNDLRVFYCSNGVSTCIGADFIDSGVFDSTKTLYTANSDLSKAIAETNGTDVKDINLQDLRSVTELTITPSSGMKDLTSLYDLQSLTKLTLKNYTGSLNGIASATKLKHIYFENSDGSQNIDYTGLEKANKITELYMYMPTDLEVEKMINAMKDTDYASLNTLGLYGFMNYDTSNITNEQSNGTRSSFKKANLLSNLSATTKKAILKMYLNNNSIGENLNLAGFDQLSDLRLNCNNISNIISLPSSIKNLAINNNSITTTDLNTIAGITNLKYLNTSSNSTLTSINNITNRVVAGKNYCIERLVDTDYPIIDTNDTTLIAKLKAIPNLKLNSKYDLILSNKSEVVIDSSFTEDQVAVLSGNTNVKILSIANCKNLSNTFLQNLLKTLPNLKLLNAYNSNLSSLDFVCSEINSNGPKLNGLDIRNTLIDDLSPINKTYMDMHTLRTNQYFDMSNYAILTKQLNRIYAEWSGDSFGSRGGLQTTNLNTLKSLENCTFLTSLSFYNAPNYSNLNKVDLSRLTDLTTIYFSGYGNIIFKLPATVTNITRIEGAQVDASLCNELTFVYCSYYTTSDSKYPNVLPNCEFQYYCNSIEELHIPKEVNILHLSYSNPWCQYVNIHKTYKPTTGTIANTVNINCILASNLIDFFADSKIKNINMYLCNAIEIPKTKDDTYTTSLSITNNKISTVNGLEGYSNLVSLNLSNNTLYNNFSTIVNGQTQTYNTVAYILQSCPKLTYINLSGNSNLTDFSALTNAGYRDNGNHVFTK